MSTMLVEEVINRLRQWPVDWPAQIAMCEHREDGVCVRADICRITRNFDGKVNEAVLMHGPMLLHVVDKDLAKDDPNRMTIDDVLRRLREFPVRWPAMIGIDDNVRDQCRRINVHQVGRHVAGKLIDGALIHGPLIWHR